MKEFIAFILIVATTACAVGFTGEHLANRKCEIRGEELEVNYRYSFLNGCRLEYQPGKFIDWDAYREVRLND